MLDDDIPEKEKPEQADIEEAVSLIRLSATAVLERVQAILDGATLAVHQVQETRFELLRKQLEATASDVLLSGFIMLCLDANVAGRVLAYVTSRIVGHMLRTNTLFQAFPSSRHRADVAVFIRYLRRTGASLAVRRELVRIEEPQVNQFRRYAAALARKSSVPADTLAQVMRSTWKEAAKATEQTMRPSDLDNTDRIGVGVLAAVQIFASNHRIAIAQTHVELEKMIRSAKITKDELKTILEEVSWEKLEEDLNLIRRRFMLLFEAVIWAKLYHFDSGLRFKLARTAPLGLEAPLRGVERKMFDYWCKRFAESIEEWYPEAAKSPKMDIPYEGFLGMTETARAIVIDQYFSAIGQALPEDLRSFVSA